MTVNSEKKRVGVKQRLGNLENQKPLAHIEENPHMTQDLFLVIQLRNVPKILYSS